MRVEILRNCRIFVTEAGGGVHPPVPSRPADGAHRGYRPRGRGGHRAQRRAARVEL